MTIYFDKNHKAYGDEASIVGKDIVFTCDDSLWQDFNNNPNKYIWENDEIVINPEWDAILLEQAKEEKIKENDTKRDEALNSGVTYKNILFDSDTDQKVNLLATVQGMEEEDTIVWFGMDNQPLECTKEDLINIGGLITLLHSFCWNKNAEIKAEISEAETIEEVENIIIDYMNIVEESEE